MLLIPLGPVNREVRRWPWVTIGIVALNVFVFAVGGPAGHGIGDRPSAAERWGFVPASPSLATADTATFLHADAWHLAGNIGIEAEIGWRQDSLLLRASAARSAGNLLDARRTLEKLLRDDPDNRDAWALAARLAADRLGVLRGRAPKQDR